MIPSLAQVYGHDEPTTVEIDPTHAHRAWAFLDIMVKSDDTATYAADSMERDALAEALVDAGELEADRL